LNSRVTDAGQTLVYRQGESSRKLLLIGAAFLLIGVYGVFFDELSRADSRRPAAWCILVLGGFVVAHELYRSLLPAQPLLELSPDGILVRIAWVTELLIPWHEVRGIAATDVSAGFRMTGTQVRAKSANVTAVLVSRNFYERFIAIPALLRGPAWGNIFIPKDTMMQVALHHDVLGVSPEELRAAIEARWHAFRERLPEVPPKKASLRVAWVVPAMLVVGMVIAFIVTSPGLWRESEAARSARHERERIDSDRRFKQAEEEMRRVMEKTGESLRRTGPPGWFDDDRPAPARGAPAR
jgi:hypothetical protein